MSKSLGQTVKARILAVILGVWALYLALHGPSITIRKTISDAPEVHECAAPIAYVLTGTPIGDWARSSEPQKEDLADECRDHVAGRGVAMGMMAMVAALALGFARPISCPVHGPDSAAHPK